MQGRVGNACFTGKLLESQFTPLFTKELSELLCQSVCHDWMLQRMLSHIWDFWLEEQPMLELPLRHQVERIWLTSLLNAQNANSIL
jgi:hypothetical protein